MAKVNEITREIEKKAPKFLAEDYDNVGMMVGDEEQEVRKVLLALDCTNEVIEEAKEKQADLIIAHHPLLFRKPKNIVKGDLTGDKIIKLIKEDISLYACHTNLDSARDGINETIVGMLGFETYKIMEPITARNYDGGGLGRIVKLKEEMLVDDLVQLIKDRLAIKNMRIARGCDKVSRIAIINGSGQDFFHKAKMLGADCIITGDTTYHFVSDFKEMGITIIDAGHFGTEYLVYLKTLEFLKDIFKDVEFMISEKSKDPYDFV